MRTVAGGGKREKKKKFGELLAAKNPNRVTALPLRLCQISRLRQQNGTGSQEEFSSMYVQRPLAYAPTPYSYTPNPTLKASVNLDEVFCLGGLYCGTGG